jgi:uncharacterized membrane protein YfcA
VEIALVLLGAFAGGFVSGLTGMGTALTALGIWLHVLSPQVAAPLAVLCSVSGSLQNLPGIWHEIEPRRVLPFVLGGVAGVPAGAHFLAYVPVPIFKLLMGSFLVAFCTFMLVSTRRFAVAWGGRPADAAVGLLGGVMGGLAGLSGVLPTVWTALRGLPKDERHTVLHTFNLTILALALVSFAIAGFLTMEVGRKALVAVPATLIGAFLGFRVYRRLDDRRFDRLVLALLLASGAALVWFNRG